MNIRIHLHENKGVVRHPTDEKRTDQCRHYFVRLCRIELLVSELHDEPDCASDNDHQREEESAKKSALRDRFVLEQGVVRVAFDLGLVQYGVSVNHRREGQEKRQHPQHGYDRQGNPGRPVVMRPHRKGDHQKAVDAYKDQDEHAAVHVEDHDGGHSLAQERSERPLLCQIIVHLKGQESTEQKVGNCQTDVPGRNHLLVHGCALHLPPTDPDDQRVSGEAHDTGQNFNPDQRLKQRCQVGFGRGCTKW